VPDSAQQSAVGKGRPPKSTRWKKGQSGNPKGRPKGAKTFVTILDSLFQRPVTLSEKGRSRTVSFLEAVILKYGELAMKGDTKIATFLLANYSQVEKNRIPELPPGVTLEQAREAYEQLLRVTTTDAGFIVTERMPSKRN
jgi:hypothetical protein